MSGSHPHIISVDPHAIIVSAHSISDELDYAITQTQILVNEVKSTASDPAYGLPPYVPQPPVLTIGGDVFFAEIFVKLRQAYLDALDNWSATMLEAYGTYHVVLHGLIEGMTAMVDLESDLSNALPPDQRPAPPLGPGHGKGPIPS